MSRRILRAEVGRGKQQLPKPLSFLSGARYVAITQHAGSDTGVWHVEVRASFLQRLIRIKTKFQKLHAKHAALVSERDSLVEENQQLKEQNAALEHVNARLLKNIEDDGRRDRYQHSPSNYFNAAEKRGFKPKGPPLQGGLAGLEKK